MKRNKKKSRKKMNIEKIKTENFERIGRTLNSDYRKRILQVLIENYYSKDRHPLTITEIFQRSKMRNYKNIYKNLKILGEQGFVELDLPKKIKHTTGARIVTTPAMVLRAIFNPIEEDLRSILNGCGIHIKKIKPYWYEFLIHLNRDKRYRKRK